MGCNTVSTTTEDTEPGKGEPGVTQRPQDDGADKTTAVAETGRPKT